MKLSQVLLTGCLAMTVNASAQASVVWNLNDFFFDGTAVTGQFTWEATTNSISDWNINAGIFSDFSDSPGIYNPSIGSAFTSESNNTLTFNNNAKSWNFRIGVSDLNLLDTAGSTLFLTPSSSVGKTGFLECNSCTPYRLGDIGASLTSSVSPVPEPSTYALMLGGLGMVGFMAYRRRTQKQPHNIKP